MPSRETGNDTGSVSKPAPLLTQMRFATFPGSTATITVVGARATSKLDMNRLLWSDSQTESTQSRLMTYQLGPVHDLTAHDRVGHACIEDLQRLLDSQHGPIQHGPHH